MREGEEASLEIWKRFRDLSIAEYKKIYQRLGIEFDVYSGESLQTEEMNKQLKQLEEMQLLSEENGAHLINLKEDKLGSVLIKKSVRHASWPIVNLFQGWHNALHYSRHCSGSVPLE